MARKLKLGRNDPCPCGSGKKYKNCCGLLNDIASSCDDPFEHYSQRVASVKLKLDRYFSTDFKKYRQTVKSRFTRFSVNRSIRPEHESIFSDWLWFDLKNDEGTSMAGIYWAENQVYMELPLRDCLKALDDSYLSVYRVDSSEGVSLDVTDIFQGSSHRILIKEPLPLKEEDLPMLILGRIISLPEVKLFSGMVLMLENNLLQEQYIKEHLNYVKDLYGEDTLSILKDYGEIIYGIFDHAGQKMPLNLSDMRIRPINENERRLLLDMLTSNQDYILRHETAGLFWFQATKEVSWYSRIIVGENLVLNYSDVLEDVIKHSDCIDSILPGQPVQVINSLMMQAPPDADYTWLWFMVLKDRESEKWLNTPQRKFNDRTPWEILTEEGGAEK